MTKLKFARKTLTVWSSETEITFPSFSWSQIILKFVTKLEWPVSVARQLPFLPSQILILQSKEDEQSTGSDECHFKATTPSSCSQVSRRDPVVSSQTHNLLSIPPVASHLNASFENPTHSILGFSISWEESWCANTNNCRGVEPPRYNIAVPFE
jgi:hypothetical protein